MPCRIPRAFAIALIPLAPFCFATTALPSGAAESGTPLVSLEEAVARADESHPGIRAAQAEFRIAEGQLRSARTFTYNPELFFEAGRRQSAADSAPVPYEVSLSQTFEFGGKRRERTTAAAARLEAARSRLARTQQLVRAGVKRAFDRALVAAARRESAIEAERIADELKTAATQRLELGAGTQLELNLASATRGRAVSDRLETERLLHASRTELAAAIGASGREVEIAPAGEMGSFGALEVAEEDLVTAALAARTDLDALRRDREAAESDLELARSSAVPDAAIIGRYERVDEGIAFLGASLPIPLFNRNSGGIAAARARLESAALLEEAARQSVERDARAAFRSYTIAREAVSAYDRDVVERIGENLGLARESFLAGKLNFIELAIVRSELVEARRAYLGVLNELIDAEYALAAAAVVEVGK